VGGGLLELVPWASCLGKFVFWSCRHLKLYIRVFDISFVMSLCCRVCAGANSGCSFFLGVFGERRRAVGKKRGYHRQSEMMFLVGGGWRGRGGWGRREKAVGG
jgi:hypothetical protein